MKTILSLLLVAVTAGYCVADDWTQFRGNGGVSVGSAKLPTKFDDETNIAWKVPMPAKGASSPIVVGDKIIATCSGGENQNELFTVCVDAKTGKELWTQKFWATGRCYCHELSANAAPTPASDGKHIVAFYSSNDIACMDMDGNLLWFRGLAVDNPKAGNDVGMSSSPVIKNGVVVAQVECQGDSFAIGLDAATGQTIWKRDRPKTAVWASPITFNANNKEHVLLQSTKSFEVLDLATGEVVFSQEGETSSISSPAFSNGKLFVPIDGTTAFAVSGDGSITKEWNSPQIRPSSMSTVVYNEKLYTLSRRGVLASFSMADGGKQDEIRVIQNDSVWATPVVAGGHMYFFAQGGKAYVVKLDGDKPKVVHNHKFEDEVFLGSPAVGNDALYVKSDRYLYKIAGQN